MCCLWAPSVHTSERPETLRSDDPASAGPVPAGTWLSHHQGQHQELERERERNTTSSNVVYIMFSLVNDNINRFVLHSPTFGCISLSLGVVF